MSQRDSGFVRIERDAYETPEWVTAALVPHIPERVVSIWEPACGSGKMLRELEKHAFAVFGTDISQNYFPPRDFLTNNNCGPLSFDAIITNPPYEFACEFIWQALVKTRDRSGFVAMLLRTDFDHAKTRSHLFDREQFSKKVVLRKRIKWIEDSDGSPSFNHAWFIWDWKHSGPPILAYGPSN